MTHHLSLPRPDDWHVHFRSGTILRAVLPFTAKIFGRAVVMPNLRPPVTTLAHVQTYRREILEALPAPCASFVPLMTLYLTEDLSPDTLEEGFRNETVFAAKLYPAHATTNADHGVSSIKNIYPILTRMERIGMPLLVHGEIADSDIDIFDREAVFIDRILIPLRRDFPELKIVLEHASTQKSVDYVRTEGSKGFLGATISPHHLHLNRTHIFDGGVNPHYYCLPIAKREKDRQALIAAATSGEPMFFLGTDSAPHLTANKESGHGPAGIFSASNALAFYAQIFDDAGKLDTFEKFASLNGAAFYKLPVNTSRVMLEKTTTPSVIKPILTEDGQQIEAFTPPKPILWRVLEA